jgi:REP element-mobilizing transposase RayT
MIQIEHGISEPFGRAQRLHPPEAVRMAMTMQMQLDYPDWGGARRGAGRKRTTARARVEHCARPRLTKHIPVHVTMRLAPGLPTLRQGRSHRVLLNALAESASRGNLRVGHYSAQSNHVHLVCEADDALRLSRGMQSLCARLARAFNRLWHRIGRVFDDRFHSRPLRSPREVRNTLAHVLCNAQHHGIHDRGGIDPFSSSSWFDGWNRRSPALAAALRHCPLPRARSCLLTKGWGKHGRLPSIL